MNSKVATGKGKTYNSYHKKKVGGNTRLNKARDGGAGRGGGRGRGRDIMTGTAKLQGAISQHR